MLQSLAGVQYIEGKPVGILSLRIFIHKEQYFYCRQKVTFASGFAGPNPLYWIYAPRRIKYEKPIGNRLDQNPKFLGCKAH